MGKTIGSRRRRGRVHIADDPIRRAADEPIPEGPCAQPRARSVRGVYEHVDADVANVRAAHERRIDLPGLNRRNPVAVLIQKIIKTSF